MRKVLTAISVGALSLAAASTAPAQMMGGMASNLFQRPAITKFVNPVVGKGAQYETSSPGSAKEATHTMEMAVVGKESVDGKDGFWMQIVSTGDKGQPILAKALISRDDFQFHKMIIQMPGQPPMEMPFNPNTGRQEKMETAMKDWHSVGTESITVPAGTFSCEHYKNDENGSDLWASDKVTPFGVVKQVGKSSMMVLTKVLNDVPDRITGTPVKFDPQQFMQQRQGQGRP